MVFKTTTRGRRTSNVGTASVFGVLLYLRKTATLAIRKASDSRRLAVRGTYDN